MSLAILKFTWKETVLPSQSSGDFENSEFPGGTSNPFSAKYFRCNRGGNVSILLTDLMLSRRPEGGFLWNFFPKPGGSTLRVSRIRLYSFALIGVAASGSEPFFVTESNINLLLCFPRKKVTISWFMENLQNVEKVDIWCVDLSSEFIFLNKISRKSFLYSHKTTNIRNKFVLQT